jgi:hypothetical protein
MKSAVARKVQPAVEQESDWTKFLQENGRVPRVTDEKKPWEYKGWLLYYRVMSENHPDVVKRWTYWIRCMDAGKLVSDPIPRIQFSQSQMGERSEQYKAITRWCEIIERDTITWSPMRELVDWLLWGFSLRNEPPKLSAKANEALYREVNIGPFLTHPFDYFGEWIAMHKGKWNPTAFFPTPHSLVEMMVQMPFTDVDPKKARTLTVCDPCTGTGRFLLHASNYSLRLYGCDIDPMVLDVAKVNGALYAPWLVRPFPSRFFDSKKETMCGLEVRNSLVNPLTEKK